MSIKNIIFDLGGVIIDIDHGRTSNAFNKLGASRFDEIFSHKSQHKLIDDYEIGKISSNLFRDSLQKELRIRVSDEVFDNAWNAMLLDLPGERLDFIKSLRQQYKVLLFSNTNDIHLKEVFNVCQRQHGINSFDGYFDKEYYSNVFGQRKPSPAAFISIIKENGMNAEETIFIDDSLPNVLGARQAGMHSFLLSPRESIFDTLRYIDEIE